MPGYTVNYRDLMDNARKISNEADRYDETAEKLKAAFEELAGGWQGPASQRFKAEQETAYSWYKSMANVCREYGEKATVAAVKYAEAERLAKEAINRRG